MMNTKKILSVAGILLGLSVSGCGNVNVDPLQLMDNPLPPLNSITAQSGAISTYVQGTFNANTPYWVFSTGFGGFAQAYTAPAAGQITELGVASVGNAQGYFVTIVHSGRLSTRIYGLQQPSVLRIGDYVVAGQVIASYFTSSTVGFQVMLDGTPVCPFSYLSSQFRSSLYTYNASQLCQ